MGISIEQYRICIGCHTNKCNKSLLYFWLFIFPKYLEIFVVKLLLKLSNDIESNPGPIKICQANVQSLMSLPQGTPRSHHIRPPKLTEIETLVKSESIDILCLSETWLNANYSDNDVAIADMPLIYRRDRGSRGGGVQIYASSGIVTKRLQNIEPTESEIICIGIQLPSPQDKHILLSQCYRPDDRDMVEFASDLLEIYEYSNRNKYFLNLFIGDFNGKHSNWFTKDVTNAEGRILQSFIDNVNCTQLINFPTRFRGASMSCLDLLICNRDRLISNIHNSSPIGKSDHSPIIFELKSNYPKNITITRNIWNFKKGDFENLNNHLFNLDWDRILDTLDVNVATNRWYDVFIRVADLYVPHKTISIKRNDLPYMNSYLKKLIRTKDHYFRKYSNSGLESDHDIYKYHRNKCVNEMRAAESRYLESLSQDLLLNQIHSKKWWNLLKRVTKNDKASALHETPIMDNNLLIYDDTCKAEAFNRFFTESIQTENPDDPIPNDHNLLYYPKIPHLIIQEKDVYNILSELDTTKATGPDNISNIFLKKCAISLAKPLCQIFNLSIKTGTFPTKWKLANVTPVFKNKGDHKLCDFYRPISLLPCVSKVLEKLLFSHIYEFLRKNKIIAPNQSGFTPKDSAIMQISHIVDQITKSMDQGHEVTAIFLDLAKAFDVVWRKGLLFKLQRVGIRDSQNCKLHSWFTSYLSNRAQCVVINGKCSPTMINNSGVPQGSVLGPLLFLIYINDLVHNLKCQSYLFADDTSLFDSANSFYESTSKINDDLLTISKWAKKWKIKINANKTEGLLISRKGSNYATPNIKLDGCNVNFVPTHKHVGIWLNTKLDWKTHIKNLAIKANKRMGILRKFKYSLPRHVLNQCYLSFVRPLMEYGGPLFINQDKADLEILDNIQMEAMHIVTGAKKLTSHDLLKSDTCWPDLSVRRELQQLSIMHKVIHNQFPLYLLNDLPFMADANNRMERKYKFNTPPYQYTFYRDSVVPSMISNWSKLPNEIRTNKNIKVFKFLFKDKYIKPAYPLYLHGERKAQMSHTRIRVKFSNLNYHLYNYGLSNSPNCDQCNVPETPLHYFMECTKYTAIRNYMIAKINNILPTANRSGRIPLDVLLHGKKQLSLNDNIKIFDIVKLYIKISCRNH